MNDHKKTIITIWLVVLFFYIGITGMLFMFNHFKNESLKETKIYIEQRIK